MKQIIIDAHFVKEVIVDAPQPIVLGIAVPDELEIEVGQWLEDDLTVRDVTIEDIKSRFLSQLSYKLNKQQLLSKITQDELVVLLTIKETVIEVQALWELLQAGGIIDLETNTLLVDNNILTLSRLEEITGIKKCKEFIANGMVDVTTVEE